MNTTWDPSTVEAVREHSRRILAVLVIATFAVSILGGFVTVWWSEQGSMAERADVALRIGAPVIGIVGTVLGFYFGREEDG